MKIIRTNKKLIFTGFIILRLESLNEKRTGVVQMVKLAEKEKDGLEVNM